eukprot:scaffold29513_cov51-Phaeocystis_antarctica.AAC.1
MRRVARGAVPQRALVRERSLALGDTQRKVSVRNPTTKRTINNPQHPWADSVDDYGLHEVQPAPLRKVPELGTGASGRGGAWLGAQSSADSHLRRRGSGRHSLWDSPAVGEDDNHQPRIERQEKQTPRRPRHPRRLRRRRSRSHVARRRCRRRLPGAGETTLGRQPATAAGAAAAAAAAGAAAAVAAETAAAAQI